MSVVLNKSKGETLTGKHLFTNYANLVCEETYILNLGLQYKKTHFPNFILYYNLGQLRRRSRAYKWLINCSNLVRFVGFSLSQWISSAHWFLRDFFNYGLIEMQLKSDVQNRLTWKLWESFGQYHWMGWMIDGNDWFIIVLCIFNRNWAWSFSGFIVFRDPSHSFNPFN